MDHLETALMIIPGYEVQAFAAPLRAQYMPTTSLCFPAHITLLYPFMSPSDLDQSHDDLVSLFQDFAPFEVILDRYRRFATAWALEPRDPNPIVELQRRLSRAFPAYLPYGGEHGPELVPHLTVAYFEEAHQGDQVELPPQPEFHFVVDRIHLYYGSTDENIPSIPLAVYPLEGHA